MGITNSRFISKLNTTLLQMVGSSYSNYHIIHSYLKHWVHLFISYSTSIAHYFSAIIFQSHKINEFSVEEIFKLCSHLLPIHKYVSFHIFFILAANQNTPKYYKQ